MDARKLSEGVTCQVAPVAQPLGSVKRMCQAGHRVVFDDEGSYIENKWTGEANWLREEDGNYIMDVHVVPGRYVEEMSKAGFIGQR